MSLKSSPSMSPGNSIKKSPAAAAAAAVAAASTTPGNALNQNFTGNHNNSNNGAVEDNNKNNKKISPTIKEVPTITIKVNKSWNLGPYLDPYKVAHLPEQFGQGPIHKVVRESVQKLVDASLDQREVFGMLRQGEGRVIITASFEDKIQKVRLLAMESESDVKDFFEILFEELRCEPFYDVFKDDFVDPEDEPLKNGFGKRKNSSNEVTLTFSNSTMPTLTAQAVNPEHASSSSTPKIPRLSNMAESSTNNGFFRENGKPNKSKVMAYHQQQRPRGRPPGAKNKVPPEARQSPKHIPSSSSPSRNTNTISTNPSNATSNSNTPISTGDISPKVSKSGPIYQNAYKLHLEQEKAKALKEAATAMKQQHQQMSEATSVSATTTTTTAMDGVQVEPSPPVLKPEDIIIPKDPTSWNIEHVIRYIGDLDPTLLPHVECFRSQEIDGNALLLLTMEMMMKYMGMKLGPALKICNIINKLLGKKYQPIPKFD